MQRLGDAMGEAFQRRAGKRRDEQAQHMQATTADLLLLAGRDPEAAARAVGRVCPHCGALLLPAVIDEPLPWDADHRRLQWPDRCGCTEEAEALAADEVDAEEWGQREKEAAWRKRLDDAGLVGRLRQATFDTFHAREDWPEAVERKGSVAAYCEAMLAGTLGDKPWLVLCGEYGCGKTHLAAAVVRAALEAGWRRVYLRSWLEYTKRIQASWERDGDGAWVTQERESQILAELQDGALVVIDDLDKRDATDWSRQTLYAPINARLLANAPTILTFNAELLEVRGDRFVLGDLLGHAVMDRVMEATWYVVTFGGPSYRSGQRWKQKDMSWTERKDVK